MSDFLKPGDLLDVLRRYSRPVRILLLCLIIPSLLLAGYEIYHWPARWPTPAIWLNLSLGVVLILVILVLFLIDPDQKASLDKLPEVKPIMDDSLKYFKFEKRLSEGRKDLIRSVESHIKAGQITLSNEDMGKCAGGAWEFDRIVHHLLVRYKIKPSYAERMEHVNNEKLILDRASWKASYAPLHYAVEAVFDYAKDSQPPALSEPEYLVIDDILGKLNGWGTRQRRRFHLDISGEGIIRNCQAIRIGRNKAAVR